MHDLFNSKSNLTTQNGNTYTYYSLPNLEKSGFNISSLPISIRIILESVLRNYDNKKITEENVKNLASWKPNAKRVEEIPFVVSRVILQDFTGVPLLCDLAAMRTCATELGKDPKLIEPLVPVDLVIDHSIQVDYYRMPNALKLNMEIEFRRNKERYQFMKWGMQAFETFKVVPPGVGIVHQVNLEYFFRGIHNKNNVLYPDTLVGTDSHTTMINGVGVVGWGVGGIEAEAAMLGQPVYFLTPDVIGVKLINAPKEGITATDIVLTITEMLRKEKVVGKFVEFFGEGATNLSATDRATISNMAPEYGATVGFFPIDENTVEFLKNTGKTEEEIELFETYFKAQNLFGIPHNDQISYTKTIELDLSKIKPSIAGPKRPQDRIELNSLKQNFINLFTSPISDNGFNKKHDDLVNRYNTKLNGINIGHGDVLIAAITSCTNTSNPSVMLAAGLLAKKAVEHGLRVHPRVKTSLAPGSRVVTEYLSQSGLLPYLEELGFNLVGYGCTTCIGNSGDLRKEINDVIIENDIITASVLSGNRNFEARIHPNIKANFLASPPLVVAFAIAGKVIINLEKDPIGYNKSNQPIYLNDIWPSNEEIKNLIYLANQPNIFKELYQNFNSNNELWNNIQNNEGINYNWPKSTYIAKPPFFDNFSMENKNLQDINNAKALLILGDSVTTDHISPAGSFKSNVPAGQFLLEQGINERDFNSYGSRRGHHDIMMRGTFANVRIKNLMLSENTDGSRVEGGFTIYNNEQMDIFSAAKKYIEQNIPTIVFAGEEYGTGSSRDWAAKGTALLGVKAVIAKSFERIHRSNLVGMGVLPLQFKNNHDIQSLNLDGSETFDIVGINNKIKPQQNLNLIIKNIDGSIKQEVELLCRIDTPIEVDYYRSGGILPYVLRQLIS
jgi:aconitate hydratase